MWAQRADAVIQRPIQARYRSPQYWRSVTEVIPYPLPDRFMHLKLCYFIKRKKPHVGGLKRPKRATRTVGPSRAAEKPRSGGQIGHQATIGQYVLTGSSRGMCAMSDASNEELDLDSVRTAFPGWHIGGSGGNLYAFRGGTVAPDGPQSLLRC